MGDLLSDSGAWASIAGVGITIFLTVIVFRLANKQRERDEIYYRHQTLSNIRTITKNIIDILNISTGNDTRTTEEYEDNTKLLKRFFKNNSYTLRLLIQDSKFTLSKWITLKPDERGEIQYIIDSLEWIFDIYFPDKGNSDELQMRIWTTHYSELEKRKNKITETVEVITTKYNQ
ncbi:MAG: hypothetical protein ACREAD_00645 [Nitrosopumilaceae archaeon]